MAGLTLKAIMTDSRVAFDDEAACIHEAGHAVADYVQGVIQVRGLDMGYPGGPKTLTEPVLLSRNAPGIPGTPASVALAYAVSTYAGPIAEDYYWSHEDVALPLSQQDLAQMWQRQWLGDYQIIQRCVNCVFQISTDNTAGTAWIADASQKAETLVVQHWAAIVHVADEVRRYRRLSSWQIRKVLKEATGART